MRILKRLMGIKKIENIRIEEIRAGAANVSKTIREVRLRLLEHVERKTEEDVLIITWKIELSRH